MLSTFSLFKRQHIVLVMYISTHLVHHCVFLNVLWNSVFIFKLIELYEIFVFLVVLHCSKDDSWQLFLQQEYVIMLSLTKFYLLWNRFVQIAHSGQKDIWCGPNQKMSIFMTLFIELFSDTEYYKWTSRRECSNMPPF